MAEEAKRDRTHYEIISVGKTTYQRLIYGEDAMKKMTASKTEGNFVKVLNDRFLKHTEARSIYRLG
jgi:hypothetical protein